MMNASPIDSTNIEWDNYQKLKMLIEGDGSHLRDTIITSGLFLLVFERLKDFAINQINSFYSDSLEIRNGKIFSPRSSQFNNLVAEHGKGEKNQHTCKDFRAAITWFHNYGALNQNELAATEKLFNLRNTVGHEIYNVLLDDKKPTPSIDDILQTFDIYQKITKWWFKEVECATNPDMTPETYDQINFDDTINMEILTIWHIIKKTLFGNADLNHILKDVKPL